MTTPNLSTKGGTNSADGGGKDSLVPSGRAGSLLVCFVLAFATLGVYARSCGNGFLAFDDRGYLTDVPRVRSGLSVANAAWALTTFHAANWHPLTWLSLQLDASLFGLRPWGFHLTNVLLHTASTLVLFAALRLLTGAVWRSATVAGLFALHPLRVESVAWVAERKDVLCGLFFMLTLLAYAWYARRPCWRRYLVVLLCFALGLMSKPMLVTMPFVLLLLDWWPLGRSAVGWRLLVLEKMPLFALTVCSCTLTWYAQHLDGTIASLEGIPLRDRLGNALVAYTAYLGGTACPVGLAAFYPLPAGGLPGWQVACAAVFLVGLTLLCVWQRGSRPYLLVGWLWYLGTLVPVIGLVQVGAQARADRYTYLPLIGIFLAAAWGTADMACRLRLPRQLTAGLAGAVLAACALSSWRQLGHWRDDVTLWTHAIQVTEHNYFAYRGLGSAEVERGHLPEARDAYRKAIEARPSLADSHYNLAVVQALLGERAQSEQQYLEAIHLRPGYAEAYNNLGALLLDEGQLDRAADCYAQAARFRPESALVWHNLGVARQRQGKWQEAAASYRRAVDLAPRNVPYRCDLAQALCEQGQTEAGRAEYGEALRLASEAGELQLVEEIQARLHLSPVLPR